MRVRVFVIDKKNKDRLYAPLLEHYAKMIRPFAHLEVIEVFDKQIAKAHDVSPQAAQHSYTIALQKYLKDGYRIALHPEGTMLDSFAFAQTLKEHSTINFFIGGAYGFEEDFLRQCNLRLSFGKITLSHKLMKAVLLEQIFRGLSINRNHPYHK